MSDKADLIEVDDGRIRVLDTIEIDYNEKEIKIFDTRPLYDMMKSGSIVVVLRAIAAMQMSAITLERRVAAALTVLFESVYRYQVHKWDLTHCVRLTAHSKVSSKATAKLTVE